VRKCKTKSEYFNLQFYPSFDRNKASAQGWQDLPYLNGMTSIAELFLRVPRLNAEFRRVLEGLFTNYCHCIPLCWETRFIGGLGKGKSTLGWAAFQKDGRSVNEAQKNQSGWVKNWGTIRITEDEAYNLPMSEALSPDILEMIGLGHGIQAENRGCVKVNTYKNFGRKTSVVDRDPTLVTDDEVTRFFDMKF